MSRATASELCAGVVLAALGAGVGAGAWRLGVGSVSEPGPGFVAFAAGTLLAAMAVGHVVRVLTAPARAGEGAIATGRWAVVVTVLVTLFGTAFLLERAGFSIATFLMLGVLFGVVARWRWWVALPAAALVTAAVRIASRALGVPLPDGPLGL